MRPPMEEAARALATVLAFLAIFLAGCATRYNYAYDPTTRFAELKSYAWASPQPRRDSLVETNVRFIADPLLEQKGFTQATDKPDIIIAIVYESEMFGPQGYELRMLTLKVYRVSDQILLWGRDSVGFHQHGRGLQRPAEGRSDYPGDFPSEIKTRSGGGDLRVTPLLLHTVDVHDARRDLR